MKAADGGAGCCGALVHHMGRDKDAMAMARRNVDAWTKLMDKGPVDAILINADKHPVMHELAHAFHGPVAMAQHAVSTLPLWLAPLQVVILNISEGQDDYVRSVAQSLQKQGFRAVVDLRNEKIGYKIREHSVQKVPYQIVVGDKERDENQVAVRARGNVDLGSMPLSAFVERLQNDLANKS